MTIRVLSLIILSFTSFAKQGLASDFSWLYEVGECELKANGEVETLDECIQRSKNEYLSSQEKDDNYYTLSFCSGLGGTDRMLLKYGFRIIASVDIDAQRNKLNNENNNDCLSEDFKYKVITGDVTTPATQHAVLDAVKDSKAKDLSSISLVYTFVPEGVGVNSSGIINSILNICGYSTEGEEKEKQEKEKEEDLYRGPKIICFELLKDNDFFSNSSIYHKSSSYYFMYSSEETGIKAFTFDKLGLPIANLRRMAYFVRKDVIPHRSALSPLKFWSNTYEKKGIVEALKISLPSSPYEENDKWWQEKRPDGSKIVAHDLPYIEEHINLQEEFISKIPGKGKPTGKTRKGTIFQVLDYPGEKDEKIWRLAEDSQLRTITAMALQPLRNIHPTQARALTFLELCVLHGMLDLGPFNLSLESETVFVLKDVLSRLAALTPPSFLEIVFDSISSVLGEHKSGSIPMNTDALCPYFISHSLPKYDKPTGCKAWIYFRDNPQHFHKQKKNHETTLQGPLPNEMPMNPGMPANLGMSMNHGIPAHYGIPMNPGMPMNLGLPVHYGVVAHPGMPMNLGMPATPEMSMNHGAPVNQERPMNRWMTMNRWTTTNPDVPVPFEEPVLLGIPVDLGGNDNLVSTHNSANTNNNTNTNQGAKRLNDDSQTSFEPHKRSKRGA